MHEEPKYTQMGTKIPRRKRFNAHSARSLPRRTVYHSNITYFIVSCCLLNDWCVKMNETLETITLYKRRNETLHFNLQSLIFSRTPCKNFAYPCQVLGNAGITLGGANTANPWHDSVANRRTRIPPGKDRIIALTERSHQVTAIIWM